MSSTRNLIILVTNEMKPVPQQVQVVQTLGRETVFEDDAKTICCGDICHIKGQPEDIRNWLSPFGGAWIPETPARNKWLYAEVLKEATPV